MLVTNNTIRAFCTTCGRFQLEPADVLQTFANLISIHDFLFPGAGTLTWMAGQVFLHFHRQRNFVTESCAIKRKRAIRNIRSMLQVFSSSRSEVAKWTACQRIADKWYHENELPNDITDLVLGEGLTVTPTPNLLLHASLMHYSPKDLLLFFVREITKGVRTPHLVSNNPSWQFLLGCVDARYPAVNN